MVKTLADLPQLRYLLYNNDILAITDPKAASEQLAAIQKRIYQSYTSGFSYKTFALQHCEALLQQGYAPHYRGRTEELMEAMGNKVDLPPADDLDRLKNRLNNAMPFQLRKAIMGDKSIPAHVRIIQIKYSVMLTTGPRAMIPSLLKTVDSIAQYYKQANPMSLHGNKLDLILIGKNSLLPGMNFNTPYKDAEKHFTQSKVGVNADHSWLPNGKALVAKRETKFRADRICLLQQQFRRKKTTQPPPAERLLTQSMRVSGLGHKPSLGAIGTVSNYPAKPSLCHSSQSAFAKLTQPTQLPISRAVGQPSKARTRNPKLTLELIIKGQLTWLTLGLFPLPV